MRGWCIALGVLSLHELVTNFKLGWHRTRPTIVSNGVICQTRDESFVAKRDKIFATGTIAKSIPSG